MRKIKDIINFIRTVKSNWDKVKVLFFLVLTVMELPAFIFHELMHVIAIIIFPVSEFKITNYYFYDVVEYDDKPTIRTYKLEMQYYSDPISGIIASAAPIIGWTIAVILLALTSHWFILTYFILGIRMFFLSEADINSMKNHGFAEPACKFLLKINNTMQINVNVDVNE